jgi:multiple sugar transport system permease protein
MKRYILFAIALCVTAVYMFPLYWMYITVFKSASEMFRYPPTFWPQHPESHLWQVFSERGMGNFLWNSLVTACGTVAVTVFVGTGAAYALAFVQNRWTSFAIFTVLVLQALPSSLMVTPIFTAFKALGLLETPRLAVVIAQITKTLPFYIVLCRPSFVQVPRESMALRQCGPSSA